MKLEEFAGYFSLGQEIQDFILKYDFANLSASLTQIPEFRRQ